MQRLGVRLGEPRMWGGLGYRCGWHCGSTRRRDKPPGDLDPIEPATAQELYLDHKAAHCAEKTVRSHGYRTNFFVQWCRENGIDDLNDLTGRHLHECLRVDPEDGQCDELLESEHTDEILTRFGKSEYASRDHVLVAILWGTGMRIGEAKWLDLCDVDLDDRFLQLRHRPDQVTFIAFGPNGRERRFPT
jgi:site-specific recombinase XerD